MQSLVDTGFEAVGAGKVDIIIILPFHLLGGKINNCNVQALVIGFVVIPFFNIPGTLVYLTGFIRIDQGSVILKIELSALKWQIGRTTAQTIAIDIRDPPNTYNAAVV
jgi:hypothetical protein